MAGESVLAKMAVEISANVANFTKQLSATETRLKGFTNNLSDIGKTVGIAFGVSAVANFAFELAKLSGEAEGVRAAFERLPESEALMSRLKDATAGTVSELELMRRTVQASNFGIGLESLPQLLEFAAIRAQQTGQSVDYLVDSIVTGIGRKSPLILDNLGISAVRLKEKLGDVSIAAADIGTVSKAVGDIAAEELQKMGGFSENAATKIARLDASWQNFKVTLGGAVTAGGVLGRVLDDLAGILASVTNADQANFIQYQKNLAESIKNDSEPAIKTMMRELNLMRNELKTPISELFVEKLSKDFKLSEEQSARFLKIVKEINGEVKKADPVTVVDPVQVTTLESLQDKIKELNEQFSQTNVNDQKKLVNIGQEIIEINAQIKSLEELRKARESQKSTQFSPNSVNAYQEAIKNLNEELVNVNVTDTSRIRILSAQIAGYQQAISNVERLKKSFQDLNTVILPPDLTPLAVNMEKVTERIEASMGRIVTAAKTTSEQVSNSFSVDMAPLVSNAIVGISEALGRAAVGVGNFGEDIIKVVAGFARQLGEILIATGTAILITKKLAIAHPALAVAAGVALVTLASAAGAAMSKAHSNSFSGGGASGGSGVERSSSRQFTPSATEAQDVKVTGNAIIRGQDLFVIFQNYQNNNQFTRANG